MHDGMLDCACYIKGQFEGYKAEYWLGVEQDWAAEQSYQACKADPDKITHIWKAMNGRTKPIFHPGTPPWDK